MEEPGKVLHIVMFPWLAIGHLKPFFRLSKCLARNGHRISFISTPRNLQRIAKIPRDLAHLINLISLPLPEVEHLPPDAESSMDVPHVKQQLLKIALDLLEPSVRSFLENTEPKPDWIVYDYASHWLPQMAAEIGISFRVHEMTKNMEKDAPGNNYDSGASDSLRFGISIHESDIVIFRSCEEFEPEWFDVVRKIYTKPVIPIGVLPMEDEEDESENNQEWLKIKNWLDSHERNSVVYVALGTEATLTHKETRELALGLEQSNFPFFWVLNRDDHSEILPDGFCERVSDRGFIHAKWAPQIKILGHPAVGGFLTHCGWNSVTEALGFGRVLILFPVMNDQGLNARLLQEKKVGIEIPRNEEDGSFTSDSVAESLRLAMVSEEGKMVKDNANSMKDLFGNKSRSDSYIDSFVSFLIHYKG